MIAKVQSLLELKVGSGFSFLLYMAIIVVYAFVRKAPFAELAPWLAGGMGYHQGQRAVTAVRMKKYESQAPCPPANGAPK